MMLGEITVVFLNVDRYILKNICGIPVSTQKNIKIPTRMATTRSFHDEIVTSPQKVRGIIHELFTCKSEY